MGNFVYLLILMLVIVSYLIGSIPNGLLIGRFFRKTDVRQHNSKNIGATNSARVLGPKLGSLVLILDILKGALVLGVLHILVLAKVNWAIELAFINNIEIISVYGLAAVLGHVFPIYLKFKGGKAAATSVGAIMALNPWIGLFTVLFFALVALTTRYASLGSLTCIPFAFLLITIDVCLYSFLGFAPLRNIDNYWPRILVAGLLTIVIFIRHRTNIRNLLTGREKKFEFDK